jgi:hypothetical protein
LQDHFRRALLLGLFRDGGPCGWRIVIFFLAAGHVTLLHFVLGLTRIELVIADSRDIGGG